MGAQVWLRARQRVSLAGGHHGAKQLLTFDLEGFSLLCSLVAILALCGSLILKDSVAASGEVCQA